MLVNGIKKNIGVKNMTFDNNKIFSVSEDEFLYILICIYEYVIIVQFVIISL